jgi:hypothetical protein
VDEKTWQRAVHAGAFGASFFLSASDVNTLARGETDTPKPTPTDSMTLMTEIKQESNAGRINSGSTAKSVKTQAFYSEVNSCQSSFGRVVRLFSFLFRNSGPLNSDERI